MPNREQTFDQIRQVAVDSYGRLRAFIASRFGDVSLAEDALSQAFLAALTTWPERGIPPHPEAWLLTTARNHLRDTARHQAVIDRHTEALTRLSSELSPHEQGPFPDQRLRLLFVCTHPAIDATVRTPLMLQTVLGLDAARIAQAYLVPAATMGQRLSRAKAKIATARIPFTVPEPEELAQRLHSVLEAIYAAYGLGWEDLTSTNLTSEALWLARLLPQLLPQQAEAHALLALILHAEARRPARRDAEGRFIPLAEQDPSLWSATLQQEAEEHLFTAHACGQLIGPFQLEAAIQSAHASRARRGRTPWQAIASLYDALVTLRPTLATYVGRAAAHAEAFSAPQGLAALALTDPLHHRFDYQPYWACLAHLSRQAGLEQQAQDAYAKAIELSTDPAVRAWLTTKSKQPATPL